MTQNQCERRAWAVATQAWHDLLDENGNEPTAEDGHDDIFSAQDLVWNYVRYDFEGPLSEEEDRWYNDALNDFINVYIPRRLLEHIQSLQYSAAKEERDRWYAGHKGS